MRKVQNYLWKTLKVIIWVILSFVLIFILIALLIQIPSIQTRIVHYATSFVSHKTHTKVEIRKISIAFPKSVVVEGIYLEDLKKDTLIYAGKAKVNIALYDMLHSQINVSSIALNDVNLNLYSTQTDPLFNYNFLLTAFSDTTVQVKAEPLTVSKWTFRVEDVSLEKIRLRYYDEYGGIHVNAALDKLDLQMDEINLEKSIYKIDELLVENLRTKVLMKKSVSVSNQGPPSGIFLSIITAHQIEINHSTVNYADSIYHQTVQAAIDHVELKDGRIDFPKENVSANHLGLSESKIEYYNSDTGSTPDTTVVQSLASSQNNWKVSIKNIRLDDNSVAYQVGNKPEIKNAFDADHIVYNHIMLGAEDLSYTPELTKVSIKEFSAIDQNNFAITSLETDFTMDEHSITANKLKANTTNSSIDADFNLQYSSLTTLIDSLQYRDMNLKLNNLRFKNSDILYFRPELIEQPFFKNSSNITTASGIFNGPLNNLNGKNLFLQTGEQTILKTDFSIQGMPNYETAEYAFPNLSLISGRKDLQMMAGPYIPKSIEVPENINVQLAFKGKMKNFESTVNLTSSFGDANLVASIDPGENFSTKVSMSHINLGRLLKDTILYGPVSLTAEASGQGLDLKTIKGKIKADVSEIYLNNYTYHKLEMDGAVSGMQFEGTMNLNDENAVADFDGLVNFNPNQERYQFKLNVLGADLQKLKLSKDNIQISFVSSADLKGGSVNKMNGTAGITQIIVARDGKKYLLDSFLTASVNEPNKSEINVNSALIDIKYAGTLSPIALPALLNQFINNYFPLSDSIPQNKKNEASNFNFEIQFHNHPILSKVLFPELKEFEPGVIKGSFDSQKNELKLNALLKKMVYGTTEITNLAVDVNSDNTSLNYKITSSAISNSQISLENFSFDGKMEGNKLFANISSTEGKDNKKLLIRSQITKKNGNYKLTLDPKEFYLMNNQWNIATDNSIEFGKQGLKIHHLFMNKAESQVNIASVNDLFNDDLNIAIRNFKLEDISQIIQKDTALLKGTFDGNVLFKKVNNSYGLIADAKIAHLIFSNIPIGNLTLKAENPTTERFNLEVNLSGAQNNLTASGYYIPNAVANAINIKTEIQSLSMKTVEAFSMGQITEAAGTLTGNFLIDGTTAAPGISGQLVFNDAFIKPAFLNNKLELKHETIELKKDGIYFKAFTLLDSKKHTAIIDGAVQMKQFSDFVFALQVNTKDFLLFNTKAKDNKDFFGRMVIDSKIDVKGPMSLPVVSAKVKMKKGSNFTVSVPEDQLTTDKGEDVVEFEDKTIYNPILMRGEKKGGQTTGMTGYDLSSIIEIDKEATLRLLMDPASTDSLVVKGEAALSFTMDQSGKMSLTGAYNLNDGSYLVSLESVIKRKFEINAGSTIIWNGDPLDASISIDATYTVRASPIDLVSTQLDGLSEVDKGAYKQRYPFLVLLKLRGEILHPEISFEIKLPPEDKGILAGAVDQKLSMLNEDESALNKQVFALLVLGRFVQENPFQTEAAGGTSTLIRSTVSKFLSSQLNQLSSKVLPGVELNFDIQSYDDYQTGEAKGRTQVEIGVKKQLFNERLSVELGGTVDVEGDKARQNNANDITSDVTVEYKLTPDGRFRMKGFRHNQYEGAIEGQLVETGAGLVFVRDFNRWSRMFRTQRARRDTLKTQEPDVTNPPK
ncbi:MAG TPA: hypothetical protein DCL77_21060 [Prolixibacteraceae bacterium]|jgi:hypothetical protein|nr:hypothetical protein [Prolixibacteraceae bacterium]